MINLSTENWSIENIDTILFDKDGTFIDLHYFWGKMTELRAKEVIERYKFNEFEKLCLSLGYDTKTEKMLSNGITALYSRPKIINIFTSDLNKWGIKVKENEIESLFDDVNIKFYKQMHLYTKPIDSAIEFIKKIKELGIKTGVVTSDSKESTLKTLDYYNWNGLFDVVIGRESTPEHKESGIPAKMALEILKANPRTIVMVGDAPMDYLAAINAGIEKTILLPTGQIGIEELKQTSEYVVKDLSQVVLYDLSPL